MCTWNVQKMLRHEEVYIKCTATCTCRGRAHVRVHEMYKYMYSSCECTYTCTWNVQVEYIHAQVHAHVHVHLHVHVHVHVHVHDVTHYTLQYVHVHDVTHYILQYMWLVAYTCIKYVGSPLQAACTGVPYSAVHDAHLPAGGRTWGHHPLEREERTSKGLAISPQGIEIPLRAAQDMTSMSGEGDRKSVV